MSELTQLGIVCRPCSGSFPNALRKCGDRGKAQSFACARLSGGRLMHSISEGLHLQVDSVMEADMKENGFRSTRRTKLICTIGPASCSFQQLETLASGGMNVARLNMCHGTHDWHRCVVVLPVVLICCSGNLTTHSIFLWGI